MHSQNGVSHMLLHESDSDLVNMSTPQTTEGDSEGALSLRVACLQCNCQQSSIEANLTHLDKLLQYQLAGITVDQRPQLLLLPELIGGYDLDNETGWASATSLKERPDSSVPILDFFRRWAQSLGAFVGGTVLEASNETYGPGGNDPDKESNDAHFYNTFVLLDPEGRLVRRTARALSDRDGLIRKAAPASFEAFLFRGCGADPASNNHILELDLTLLPAFKPTPDSPTPPPRKLLVGVAICYENMLLSVMQQIQQSRVDLILTPYSAPYPIPDPWTFPEKDAKVYQAVVEQTPVDNSKRCGAHVVSVNKAGSWESRISRFWGIKVFYDLKCGFLELTKIVDGRDGKILAQVPANKEALIVSTLTFPPDKPYS
ncbi:hypothetical protein HK102_009326, partial [Quaeritorhiza haematococci]